MTDTQETNNQGTELSPQEQFGVTAETKSKNTNTPFNPGITKGILIKVEKEEVGKETKYTVLSFTFKDIEGNRTYKHTEFAVTSGDKIAERKEGLNVRLKHIFEAFTTFPITGMGNGATSWADFFEKCSIAFNTGNNGKPIFIREEAEKKIPIVVYLKVVYSAKNKKDDLGFPIFPNFIEKVTAENTSAPKTIVIDKKFDRLEQLGASKGNMMGGGGAIPNSDDDFGSDF